MILLDVKVLVHSLVSEPVFLIPILSFIFKIEITRDIVIIIAVFQILSAVSIQMGKFVPPEFQAGAVAAFIMLVCSSATLSASLIIGLFIALAAIPVFEIKIRINRYIASRMNYVLGIALSILFSFTIYAFLIIMLLALSPWLNRLLHFQSNAVVFFMLSLPFLYAIRLKSGNEPLYFIMGILIGGIFTWIKYFSF